MNTNKSSGSKEKNRPIQLTDEMKKQFFDVGSSLLLYGSKRLYKQYLFFRDFSNNPLIKQCKYYKQDLLLYVMADILITIRKEVGLNLFNTIKENEALGFFVNDLLNNPITKEKAINSKLYIKLVKFELYIIEQTRFTILKKLYLLLFKPIIGLVSILIKFIIVIPYGRLLLKLFPNFPQKISAKEESKTNRLLIDKFILNTKNKQFSYL